MPESPDERPDDAETADNVYELGTDTFVVRNGKIVAQSYTSKLAPKNLSR